MIPIRDDNPYRQLPVITTCLIVINVAIYFYQLFVDKAGAAFIYQYGAIPFQITHFQPVPHLPRGYHPPIPYFATIFTSMFIHGGFFHLFSNMLYLWIFGDNVEYLMGKFRFLVFYLVGGFVAALGHIIMAPNSQIPMVGASGAVSAVLGAYFIKFPRAKVQILLFFFIFIQTIYVPAVVVLGLWFLMQLFSGISSLGLSTSGGVAWFAHIGGFLAGIGLVNFFQKRRLRVWW